MEMTLDYNNELFPLKSGQNFALALASSLQRSGASKSDGAGDDGEEKEQDVWRPDGKGRRGLEDDYHYVMYGKVRASGMSWAMHLLTISRSTNSMGVQQRSCMSAYRSKLPSFLTFM